MIADCLSLPGSSSSTKCRHTVCFQNRLSRDAVCAAGSRFSAWQQQQERRRQEGRETAPTSLVRRADQPVTPLQQLQLLDRLERVLQVGTAATLVNAL